MLDPEDIDVLTAENRLMALWRASQEVAYPEVVWAEFFEMVALALTHQQQPGLPVVAIMSQVARHLAQELRSTL